MSEKIRYAEYKMKPGGDITKDGHTMFGIDIVKDLRRKSYLEEQLTTLTAERDELLAKVEELEQRKTNKLDENIWAKFIHYPACWDTMAYPTLEDAIHEALAWSGCSECKAKAMKEDK